jgi:hypothetical protein
MARSDRRSIYRVYLQIYYIYLFLTYREFVMAILMFPTFSRLFRIKNNIVEKKSQGTAKSEFACW